MNLLAFDLDGTLEDSRADMVAAVNRVRAGFGLPVRADAQLRPHVNRGMAALYAACFDDALAAGWPLAQIRDAYVADYGAHIADQSRVYPGVAEALDALVPLGVSVVVTNKPEGLSERLLFALGLRGRFSAVVGGDSAAEEKPSPLPLALAAERVGFDRGRGVAVMIGDSAGDIATGRAFGAATVWCAWGYAASFGPLSPDAIAETPAALPGCLAALLRP